MQQADPLPTGSVVAGRYRLGALLGTGGMSSVHRADDEVLGRQVAMKIVARGAPDAAESERIRAEIDLLASLQHRALVTLFDAGTAVVDGRPVTYLAMELVEGPTLGQRAAAAPIPVEEVTRMAQDLAEALVVVHARGVVHRDIKPANILLAPALVPGREFDAKLADFGIASLVDGARLTATGTVLGTAGYLSPEQATGSRVAASSDIYSLGLVLLEALTGRREFPGTMLESVSARLARDPVVPGELGYEWKSLLSAMTARDPEARPAATAVLERVTAWSAAAAPGGAEPTGAEPTGAMIALAGTALLAAQPDPTAAAPIATAPVTAAPSTSEQDTVEQPAPARGSRRRRWPAVATLVAAVAALVVAAPLATLQWSAPTPTADPAVAETMPKAPTAPIAEAPAPTSVEPAAPAPAPAPVPAVVPATETADGNGNGNGNGNGSGSNSGSGSGSDANSGNGNDNGNGNGGSGNGGSGNGNGGNGNGNGP
ncbi:serine/threonine-protein kinase [Agrococcus beijingensis]|uniref:serine/threonine-protein kinase n=1 Tax=Agrococcus beijingensis TaxID=3068634 RepID=UPI0027411243|nr:serine/threonine-protein kinase [Agrococcus sp. REN33]